MILIMRKRIEINGQFNIDNPLSAAGLSLSSCGSNASTTTASNNNNNNNGNIENIGKPVKNNNTIHIDRDDLLFQSSIDNNDIERSTYLSYYNSLNEFCNEVDEVLKPIQKIKTYYSIFGILFYIVIIIYVIMNFVYVRNAKEEYIRFIMMGIFITCIICYFSLYINVRMNINGTMKNNITKICNEKSTITTTTTTTTSDNNNNYNGRRGIKYELGDEHWGGCNKHHVRRYYIIVEIIESNNNNDDNKDDIIHDNYGDNHNNNNMDNNSNDAFLTTTTTLSSVAY